MTDAIEIINNKQATISISRKVSVRQYESLEASIYMPVDMPESNEDSQAFIDELHKNVKDAFYHAKVLIFDQLGLEYEDRNGVIAERVARAFNGTVEVPRAAPSAPNGAQSAPKATDAPDPTPASSSTKCPKCEGPMWDNRKGKRNPKAPDFKCRDQACAGVVWPPRGQ